MFAIRRLVRQIEVREPEAVARWLLGLGDAPPADVLRQAGLAAYGYWALPVRHPLRTGLRSDFLGALVRHYDIKREIMPLLGAWRAAGLDVLLFKGFQLTESVYPVPGIRFHGDVDVLIRPEHLARAQGIARSHGWTTRTPLARHCAYELVRCGGSAMVDVHRWGVHARLPWTSVQQRITNAVWDDSRAFPWEGVDVREPSPVDSGLVGIILQRCWGGEQWRPKPFDIIDLRQLRTHYGVDRRAILARARQLRCERTVSVFFDRCDPDERRLKLSRPTRSEQFRGQRAAFKERGLVGEPERRLARVLSAPQRALTGAAFVPAVLRVRLALRRHRDLRNLLRVVTATSAAVKKPRPDEPERVIRGVRWAIRFIGAGPYGGCLVRSLAVYAILRRRGWPVEFVSGVRGCSLDDAPTVGHAWVEHGGAVLWELRESSNHAIYRENFRYPKPSSAASVP